MTNAKLRLLCGMEQSHGSGTGLSFMLHNHWLPRSRVATSWLVMSNPIHGGVQRCHDNRTPLTGDTVAWCSAITIWYLPFIVHERKLGWILNDVETESYLRLNKLACTRLLQASKKQMARTGNLPLKKAVLMISHIFELVLFVRLSAHLFLSGNGYFIPVAMSTSYAQLIQLLFHKSENVENSTYTEVTLEPRKS